MDAKLARPGAGHCDVVHEEGVKYSRCRRRAVSDIGRSTARPGPAMRSSAVQWFRGQKRGRLSMTSIDLNQADVDLALYIGPFLARAQLGEQCVEVALVLRGVIEPGDEIEGFPEITGGRRVISGR